MWGTNEIVMKFWGDLCRNEDSIARNADRSYIPTYSEWRMPCIELYSVYGLVFFEETFPVPRRIILRMRFPKSQSIISRWAEKTIKAKPTKQLLSHSAQTNKIVDHYCIILAFLCLQWREAGRCRLSARPSASILLPLADIINNR